MPAETPREQIVRRRERLWAGIPRLVELGVPTHVMVRELDRTDTLGGNVPPRAERERILGAIRAKRERQLAAARRVKKGGSMPKSEPEAETVLADFSDLEEAVNLTAERTRAHDEAVIARARKNAEPLLQEARAAVVLLAEQEKLHGPRLRNLQQHVSRAELRQLPTVTRILELLTGKLNDVFGVWGSAARTVARAEERLDRVTPKQIVSEGFEADIRQMLSPVIGAPRAVELFLEEVQRGLGDLRARLANHPELRLSRFERVPSSPPASAPRYARGAITRHDHDEGDE